MQKIIAAAAVAALALSAAPAFAGQAWQVGSSSYHLYLNDLDLNSSAGRAEALTRVETAAARLCGTSGVRSEQKACIAQTVKTALNGTAANAIHIAMDERSGVVALAQAK